MRPQMLVGLIGAVAGSFAGGSLARVALPDPEPRRSDPPDEYGHSDLSDAFRYAVKEQSASDFNRDLFHRGQIRLFESTSPAEFKMGWDMAMTSDRRGIPLEPLDPVVLNVLARAELKRVRKRERNLRCFDGRRR